MTLNTYKQDQEKAQKISEQIRRNNAKTIYPASHFIHSLNEVKNELNQSVAFLEAAAKNPVLLFTEAKDNWGSHRDILYRCVDYSGRQTKEGTIHEFQAFLAVLMNDVLQAWRVEQGIEQELTIQVRTPNSFPSIYAVYQDNKELMQFNIFEKTYGSRNQGEKEEKILQAGQREEIRLKEEEKKEQAELEKLLLFKEKPYSHILSPRDFYHVVFRHKQLMVRLEHFIKQKENTLENIRERIQGNRDQLPFVLKDNEDRRGLYSLIKPFFLQFDYLLETNQSKLY